MKTITYPVGLPEELYSAIQQTANETSLSMADAIRQSIKLGLPKLREKLSGGQVRPMTREEAREAYAPDAEWDNLESAMTKRAVHRVPEGD